MAEQNEIILYQPNELTKLEVRLVNDTVWLSQQQMAMLFQTTPQNITMHIRNLYNEGEQLQQATCKDFLQVRQEGERIVSRNQKFYNLDIIISVGYRIKSMAGVRFRQWATSVLREYTLRGYAINHRLMHIESELAEHRSLLQKHENQLEFYVRTALPPAEQVFFEGSFMEARVALEALVKTAKQRVVVVDGYVDAMTLDILDVRAHGVTADIYTVGLGEGMRRLMTKHDEQKGKEHIDIHKWRNESHDRWLIIDDTLYHCGHSLNAMGTHLSAITKMGIHPDDILKQIK